MKFMIVLMVGKVGSFAKKIGIASICVATALSGFTKDYSVVDNIDSKIATSGLEKVVSNKDNTMGIPVDNKIINNGRVLYSSDRGVNDENVVDYNGEMETAGSGTIVTNFQQYLEWLNDVERLPEVKSISSGASLGNDLQFRDSSGHPSVVSNWVNIGFVKNISGIDRWVGYADNIRMSNYGYSGHLYGNYILPLAPEQKPDNFYIISDVDNDGIGFIDSSNNFHFDKKDYTYCSQDVLFSNILSITGEDLKRGDVSQLPTCTYDYNEYLPYMLIAPWTTNGMSIGWGESHYGFTNNFEGMSNGDSDYDGHAAFEEYIADTNPTNSTSVFSLSCGGDNFKFNSSTNCSYNIDLSNDLENWINISSNVAGDGGEMSFNSSSNKYFNVLNNPSNKYFKVRVNRTNEWKRDIFN